MRRIRLVAGALAVALLLAGGPAAADYAAGARALARYADYLDELAVNS